MVLGGNLEHYFRSSQYQASIRHQGLRGHLASSFLQLLSLSISSGGELEIEVRFRGGAPVFLFLHLYPSPSFLPFFPLSSLLSPSSYENLSVCVFLIRFIRQMYIVVDHSFIILTPSGGSKGGWGLQPP